MDDNKHNRHGKHPSDVAYRAGIKFYKGRPTATDEAVEAEAKKYDDEEAFRDGFYNTLHRG